MSRLFYALWPTPTLRAQLATWASNNAPEHARPVSPANLHLTLAFIGSLPEERLDAVLAAGTEVRAAPVSMPLTRIEHWARPRLLCAVPAIGNTACAELVNALRQALLRHLLPVESRPFRPHVTLVRKVRKPLMESDLWRTPTWSSDRLALVVSESAQGGVRYRELAGWPLDAGR